ncbi:MAG: ATP phosphoribosyltransferase [Polyangiaceae bacterium]
MASIRVALPNKGRLSEEIKTLFDDAGLPIRGRSERSLVASIGGEFEAIFVRAEDIPELVADGAADCGITGWDLVCETDRGLASLLDLEFGRCRLVVAVKEDGSSALPKPGDSCRVATKFVNLARKYFVEQDVNATIVPFSGAVEVAPHLGIADIVVDLTSTGSTLKMNGLREVATVVESTARLIARDEKNRPAEIDELTIALASVLRARGRRYLMANVPRDALTQVRECLPGLNGPTLSEIMDAGHFVAMHAVVPADTVYKTIGRLKALGCEGILVTRIERLMP